MRGPHGQSLWLVLRDAREYPERFRLLLGDAVAEPAIDSPLAARLITMARDGRRAAFDWDTDVGRFFPFAAVDETLRALRDHGLGCAPLPRSIAARGLRHASSDSPKMIDSLRALVWNTSSNRATPAIRAFRSNAHPARLRAWTSCAVRPKTAFAGYFEDG